VLATSGLDDRSTSNGYLSDAQALMADAVGADTAFFSTCGSSLSVKAAMLAVAGGKGDLLIGRDAHKSVIAGLVLSGVQPHWIWPRYDQDLHLAHPPSPDALREAFETHPYAAGALIVSPTPYGSCADVQAIAEICHRFDKPLIVDEAWGAHLPFHEDLPTWAMDAGADICVVSVHKMGTGFEQGSVFHLQGKRVDAAHLSACADMLMTTSPNVLLYAGIDGWRRQMVEQGCELLDAALRLGQSTRDRIEEIPGLHVLHDEFLQAEASHDLDPLHVVMDVEELDISGYAAADWLREHCQIDVGLSDHRRIEATLSIADDHATVDRLVDALCALVEAARDLPPAAAIELPSAQSLMRETAMLPRDAFFAPMETVKAAKAAGRIAAEQITPYPPGIPVLIPGERVTPEIVDYLQSGVRSGMQTPDAADGSLKTIRVVAGH
jgi:lysine decarboxylase